MTKPPLERVREATGIPVRRMAEFLELDISGLVRIERGQSTPKPTTAAAVWSFYGGAVPLGMIYDTGHPSYADWLTKAKEKELAALGRRLVQKHPELAEHDRRKRVDEGA